MSGQIHAVRKGHLGWLTFDHPERRNALSVEMWRQIPAAVKELAIDDEVRVVVMRGEGDSAFVSGADVSQFEESRTGDAARAYDQDAAAAVAALLELDKPLLAMIHGACFGGGVAVALAADLRYAAENALFAIPAARLGVAYPFPALQALTDTIGFSAAKEILFTGRRFQAREALRMGLVDGVVPADEIERLVGDTAARISANAPLSLRSVKVGVRELARDPGLRDTGRVEAAARACLESDDYREGIRAFLEKRRPRFTGR